MHKITIFAIGFILALQTLAFAGAPKQFLFWRTQRGNEEDLHQSPQTSFENSDISNNKNLAGRFAKWRQNRQNRYQAFAQRVQDNFPKLYRKPNAASSAGENKFTVVQYW